MPKLTVEATLAGWLGPGQDVFAIVETVPGDVVKAKDNRVVKRVELDDRVVYVKLHRGVGWREIVKNLVTLKAPVLGAQNEWRALKRLQTIGVPTLTPLAFAARGINPARQHSFLVTQALEDAVSVERLLREDWRRAPPDGAFMVRLVNRMAHLTRTLHDHGINHRDLYLSHFLLRRDDLAAGVARPYLVDLHRAQLRTRVPRRWRIKDLGGLLYSALDSGVGRRAALRFGAAYDGDDAMLWRAVERRARSLYRKAHGSEAPFVTARRE